MFKRGSIHHLGGCRRRFFQQLHGCRQRRLRVHAGRRRAPDLNINIIGHLQTDG